MQSCDQYVCAIHDFDSPEDGEIQLAAGDIVQVIGEINNNWLVGTNLSLQNNLVGNFPKNFVKALDIPIVSSKNKLFVAVRSFQAVEPGDLEFQKGDIIIGTEPLDENWWNGETGRSKGIFPLTFVRELNSTAVVETCPSLASQPISESKVIARGKANLSLTAQLDEELNFSEGDIIDIVQVIDDGFAIGSCGGSTGQFPLAFVDIFEGTLESKDNTIKRQSSKFDWWRDPSASDALSKRVSLELKGPQPSFEEQTAPITVEEEEYTLNTSHRFYTSDANIPPEEAVNISPEVNFQNNSIEINQNSCLAVDNINSNRNETVQNGSIVTRYARGIFNFVAENDNELSLVAGEIVTVIRSVDDQWLEGKIGEKFGIFPRNFVEFIEDYNENDSSCLKSKSEHLQNDINSQRAGKDNSAKCKHFEKSGEVGICTELPIVEKVSQLHTNDSNKNSKVNHSVNSLESSNYQPENKRVDRNNTVNSLQSKIQPGIKGVERKSSVEIKKQPENKRVDGNSTVNSLESQNQPENKKPGLVKDILENKLSNNSTGNQQIKPPVIKPKPNIKPKSKFDAVETLPKSTDGKCKDAELENSTGLIKNDATISNVDQLKILSGNMIGQDKILKSNIQSANSDLVLNSVQSDNKISPPRVLHTSASFEKRKEEGYASPSTTTCHSPVSPTVDLSGMQNEMSVHYKSPGQSSVAFVQANKSPPSKDNRKSKSAAGLQVGSSRFYDLSGMDGPPPSNPVPAESRKNPPRPDRPRTVPVPDHPGDRDKHKPVPCRAAPPRPAPAAKQGMPSENKEDKTSHHQSGPGIDDAADSENGLVIEDLERRIAEIEADLEKCFKEQSILNEHLYGATNDEEVLKINESLEFYKANIQGLADELTQLRDNLQQLKPRQSNRSRTSRHVRFDSQQLKLEFLQKERRKQREKVINELIQTENDYFQWLCLCFEIFFNKNDTIKCPAAVDVEMLFGNMVDVMELSQRFINLLESKTAGKSFEEQIIGSCFEEVSEELKKVYAIYCRNHDDVIALLEKYESIPEMQAYFNALLSIMKQQVVVFDLGSILIKPVQRIMKYPLLLGELIKATEEDHPDRARLLSASSLMTEVVQYINEYKRRKDLVHKYKNSSDIGLGEKFSRLSLHSVRKKLGRLSMMVAVGSTVDERFSRVENQFQCLVEFVRILLNDVVQYMDLVQETLGDVETLVNDIADYHDIDHLNPDSAADLEQLCVTIEKVAQRLFVDFKNCVHSNIVPPLKSLQVMFRGPKEVIRKRYHKLLDYENATQKLKNNGDGEQLKSIREEVEMTRKDYEALNSQLLEDLPKLYMLSISVVTDCIHCLIQSQESFFANVRDELRKLLQLKIASVHVGFDDDSITDEFNILHTQAVDRLSELSFIPKSFNPLVDEKRKMKGQKMEVDSSAQSLSPGGVTKSKIQSDELRSQLREKFPTDKLFLLSDDFNGTQLMDLTLMLGTVVGIIKQGDPMGNKERFYVTDGEHQGFVLKRFLVPYDSQHDTSSTSSEVCHSSTSSISSTPTSKRSKFFLSTSTAESLEEEDVSPLSSPHAIEHRSGIDEGLEHLNEEDENDDLCEVVFTYVAETESELSVTEGEFIRVLQKHDLDGNLEWWLVEAAKGRKGYVPASYLKGNH